MTRTQIMDKLNDQEMELLGKGAVRLADEVKQANIVLRMMSDDECGIIVTAMMNLITVDELRSIIPIKN